MSHYPGFIRRLLSTTVLGYFESYDNPVALAAIWPMNGDREWAEHCVEWLNHYLAKLPTSKESLHLVFSGWHECPLLTHEKDFTLLIEAIRDRLIREIPVWRHEQFETFPFEKE
ncbi:MAG: hypothetical protein FGM26_10535 [Beijerinckiaceae bacterium]|nr:hypothetical protein [Beijerinckiaceae bacterium]